MYSDCTADGTVKQREAMKRRSLSTVALRQMSSEKEKKIPKMTRLKRISTKHPEKHKFV